MLPVREFYAGSRWGDEWDVVRVVNGVVSRHRGHDIVAGTHEEVPALRGGRVVTRGRSPVLGHYLVLNTGRQQYDFYCHLLDSGRPGLAAQLKAGDGVGRVAGRTDFHGSAWSGVHLHFGYGPSIISVTTGVTYDATALIKRVLGTQPAEVDTAPFPIPAPEEDDMLHFLAISVSKNGMIGAGQRFIQGADGRLRCLSGVGGGEWAAWEASGNVGNVIQWTGDQIAALVGNVGLYEYAYDTSKPGNVGRLTGRILFGPSSDVRNVYDPRVTTN